jgi:hypothetical protein
MDLIAEIDGIKDFHYLCLPLLNQGLDELETWSTPDFHWQLYKEFDELSRETLTVAPVGFAKSTILKVWGIYQFVNKIDPYILYVSSSASKADKQFESILKILKEPVIQTIYRFKVIKDTMAEVVIQFDDGKKQKFESIASGKDILGINFEGQRPTLILIDDIEEEDQARSVERTDKLMNWLLTSLISRLPNLSSGRVRMIGTVLSKDSLTNRILGKSEIFNQSSNRNIFRDWAKHFHQALKDGKSIWEDIHKTEALLKEQQLKPQIFASNYMNEPLDEIITGAVYERECQKVIDEDRYSDTVKYNPNKPVDTYWDFAVNHDLNAVWFVQVDGGKVNLIDYWEGTKLTTQEIASIIKNKGYLYGRHFAPHDVKKTHQGETANRTTEDLYRSQGIYFSQLGKAGIESGIQATRDLFDRFYFRACPDVATGFNHLKSWRNITTDNDHVHSNASDSLRYLSVSIKLNQSEFFETKQAIRRKVTI